jgi:hypothetical protein
MMRIPPPDYVKHGQAYWRLIGRHREHVTRAGRTIILDVWASFCAEPDCGAWFECTAIALGSPEVRRCAGEGQGQKMTDAPHVPQLAQARAAARCGARRKSDGRACQQPAMRNKTRCRLHGGKSTGPRTPEGLERSGRSNWKHGYYSVEAKAARRKGREAVRTLRQLLSLGIAGLLFEDAAGE